MDGLDLANNPATNGAKDVLTKKYGPLPFYAWLILAGGTAYAVKKYTSKKAAASVVTDPTAGAQAATAGVDPLSSVPTGGGYTTGVGNIAGTYGGQGVAGSATVSSAYDTNAAWIVGATSVLAGLGQWSSYTINQALTKYVNGVSLTTDPTSAAIVKAAIDSVGAPPEGVPVGDAPTTPATTPVVAPAAFNPASTIVATLMAPIPSKVGQQVKIQLTWKDANGKGLTGRLQAQAPKGNQWVNLDRMLTSGGVGVYTHTLAVRGAVETFRFIPSTDSPYTGTSNSVSVTTQK